MLGATFVIALLLHLSEARLSRFARSENDDFTYVYGSSGEIRLMSPLGSTRAQPWGVVQVRHNGVWGTVCQNALNERTLDVICREMGVDAGYRVSDDEFPSGNADSLYGAVTLGNPQCTGTESRLLDCQHQGLGNGNCRHYADIKVQCYTAGADQTERLRLVDAAGNAGGSSGRVEVLHNGVWGTVCNSYSDKTPHFICSKLGYNGGVVLARDEVPASTDVNGPIWAVGLSCVGPIENIIDCMYGHSAGYGVLVHGNCWHHQNDLGLSCGSHTAEEGTLQQDTVEDGGGAGLTLFHQGVWWQVCSHQFGYAEATVACRQLRQEDVTAILPLSYDEPDRAIWLKDFDCDGDEEMLIDCPRTPEAVSCRGGSAAVRCGPAPERRPGEEKEIQLVDGITESQGRVEIFHDGAWGTICKGGMGTPEAEMICGQLGYDSGHVEHKYWETYGGRLDTPIYLDNVNCTAVPHAMTIADCAQTSWGHVSCDRDAVVWVNCEDNKRRA